MSLGLIELVAKEPSAQFDAWFQAATACDVIPQPKAFCLATCSRDGRPSNRIVELKSFHRGCVGGGIRLIFTTSYTSRKGREMTDNPHVAATFFWEPLRRSVRLEGTIEKESREDFERFFRGTSTEYQIVKANSGQSDPVESLEYLREKVRVGEPVEIPETIGGYVITPHTVEFWQGQPNRIHDRIRFRRPLAGEEAPDGVLLHEGVDGWVYERLAP